MGQKKHSQNRVIGEGKLRELVAEFDENDGKRFGDGPRNTHKGLPVNRKAETRQKFRPQDYDF
jgi:hypothetical protein